MIVKGQETLHAIKSTLLGTCAVIMSVFAGVSVADIYARKDVAGVTHYSNIPGEFDAVVWRVVAQLERDELSNRAQVKPVKGNAAVFAEHVNAAAIETGLDPALVHAVITAESGYNPNALSRAGAQGLMQLMPNTAKRYGVKDAYDPAANIMGGTRYLRDLLDMFDNNTELAVAAYNAGEQAVIKHQWRVPPYRETLAYVPKVLKLYQRYAAN